MSGMASQRILKTVVRKLLPLGVQLRLRRFVLARRIARGEAGIGDEMSGVRAFLSPGDVVLDIGANAGAFAVAMAKEVGPRGRVFAFEPIPDTYDVLVEAVRLSSLANIETLCLAASDHPGRADFVIPEAEAFAGFYQAHVATDKDAGSRIAVELDSLDSLLSLGRIPPASFIKCDVEGHELAVLRGARELVGRHVPNWYMEVARATSAEVFEFLLTRGYSAAVWNSGEFTLTRTFVDRTCNYFFFHPDNPRTAAAGLPGYPPA
jgi:FkbM family methyltransferase